MQKDIFPELYSAYNQLGSNYKKITQALLYGYCDEKISEEELNLAINESQLDCLQSIKDYYDYAFDIFQGELPEDFPRFKTQPEYEQVSVKKS